MTQRENTRAIRAGSLVIGGGAPVSVQSMTNTDPRDAAATGAQVQALAEAGAQLVRLAVPDEAAAAVLGIVRRTSPVPLCADIHFDHRLAIAAAEAGADKLRINPGNIGGAARVRDVAACCAERGVPIRVGVNGGSLERALLDACGGVRTEAMLESARRHVGMLEDAGFADICLSFKASNAAETIAVNRRAAALFPYPLHLGVTETGVGRKAVLKSAVGIGALLALGIGDTVRVSLTGDPVEEVAAALDIVEAAGCGSRGIDIVSCPTCGRTKVDLVRAANTVAQMAEGMCTEKRITVAVMGCAVNGPGEARAADLGIAGGDGEYVLFANGEIIGKYPEEEALRRLRDMLRAQL